jgi:hypothetical protein
MDQASEAKGPFADVHVTVDEDYHVSVSDEEVVIYFDRPGEPHAVRWIVHAPPMVQVQIKWELVSPFRNLGVTILGGGTVALVADGNRGRRGLFRYSVLAIDEKGSVRGGVDPWIKNTVEAPMDFD